MAAQPPSFVSTIGPRAKYDPIIDKEKFEKELVRNVFKVYVQNDMYFIID